MLTAALALCLSAELERSAVAYIAANPIPDDAADLVGSPFYKRLDRPGAGLLMYIVRRPGTPEAYADKCVFALNLVGARLRLDMVPFAVGLLTHRSESVRAQAVFALGRFSGKTHIKLFYHILHTDGPHASRTALNHVAEHGDSTDLEPLRVWLRSDRCHAHGPEYNERVRRAFDDFAGRLREEIDR